MLLDERQETEEGRQETGMKDSSLPLRCEKTIRRYGMLSKGDKVLLGVSGGSDSVFLLHLLHALSEKYSLTLHVAHLNHGFRREAEKEAIFVKGLAEGLGIPYTLRTINVPSYAKEKKLSRQEAAREVRYSFLREVATEIGANKIALGHTADDQAETFLMKLIRGAGAKGMSGIHPCFLFTVHGSLSTVIIRPLIDIGRKEIMDYLREKGVPFIEDPSNITPAYLRNRIRNELIPLIEKNYNPKVKETFVRSAEILREEDSFLENYVRRVLPEFISLRKKGRIELLLKPFLNLDKAIQRRIIRIVIEELKGDLKGYSMLHINEVIDSIAEGQTGRRINLPKGIMVQRDYDHLSIYLKEPRPQTPESRLRIYDVIVPGVTQIPEFGLTVYTEIKEQPFESGNGKIEVAFDLEKIPGRVGIRMRKEGDRFFPSGMGGRSKKLKSYLIDKKIKRDERDRIPILVSGDDILWIVGHRQDERYRAGKETKRVLLVRAERGIYGSSW